MSTCSTVIIEHSEQAKLSESSSTSSIGDLSFMSSVSTLNETPFKKLSSSSSSLSNSNDTTMHSSDFFIYHYSPSEFDKLTLEDIDSLTTNEIDYYFQILASFKVQNVPKAPTPPPTPTEEENEPRDRNVKNASKQKHVARNIKTEGTSVKKSVSKKVSIKNPITKPIDEKKNAKKADSSNDSSTRRPYLRSAAKARLKNEENNVSKADKNDDDSIENINPKLKRRAEKITKSFKKTPSSSNDQKEKVNLDISNVSNNFESSTVSIKKRSVSEIGSSNFTMSYDENKTSRSGLRQFFNNVSKIWFDDSNKYKESDKNQCIVQSSLLRPRDFANNGGEPNFPKQTVLLTPDRDRRMQEIANFKGTLKNNFHERRNLWERRSFKG